MQRPICSVAIAFGFIGASIVLAQGQQSEEGLCAGGNGVSLDQQISSCTTVIDAGKEPTDRLALAFRNRGAAYFVKADYDRAIQDFNQAIKLNPENAAAYDCRCWTRAVMGNFSAALADCNESLKLRPNYGPTLDTRGFAYLKSGDFSRAVMDYDAALKVLDAYPYSLYGRGIAKLKKGDSSGEADIRAAKAIKSDIGDEFKRYGVK